MIHLMFDIETLGTTPDSVVLSVAAIRFNPVTGWIGESQEWLLDTEEQSELGRRMDEDTMAWWSKQDPVIVERMFSDLGRVSLSQFASEFKKLANNCDAIWAHGVTFDVGIIEHLMKQIGVSVPWSYGKVHDSRTLFSVFGDTRPKNRDQAHDALADCAYQIQGLIDLYEKFKNKELV